MKIERFILITSAVISISSIIYIPKKDFRKALLSFLTFQAASWAVSIMLRETGRTIYPVREFIKATKVVFIPQFFVYPTLFMWFILLFPKHRSIMTKIMHYVIFVSIMLWYIFFTSKYTNISTIPDSNDFSIVSIGYLRNFIQFGVCHIYVSWFFKKEISS